MVNNLSDNTPRKKLLALLIEDSAVQRAALAGQMRSLRFNIIEAEDGPSGVVAYAEHRPDLVLLDLNLPGMSGIEVVERIRHLQGHDWVPVLFLSATGEDGVIESAIVAGGDDYLVKPVSSVVLGAKIRALRRMQDMRLELLAVSQALRLANRQLEELSDQDTLTEIANRRAFNKALEREFSRAVRNQTTISLVMVDVDHFKKFNDHYGHPEGDRCLKAVAFALRGVAKRPADLAARIGGEEFVLLLPDTDAAGAMVVADFARNAVVQTNIPHAQSSVASTVTVSLGVCTLKPTRHNRVDDLITGADEALYVAKNQGRNRAAIASDLAIGHSMGEATPV